MSSLLPIAGKQRRQILTMLVFTSISFYFAYHLVSGNNGLLAVMQLTGKLEQTQKKLDEVKAERLALQNRVKMMSPESLDLDLLDEQSRKVLGRARPNEIIYFVPQERKDKRRPAAK